ncbi:hypothetical protein IZ6_07910 [Terrihabitans soli]|uniref:Uncharacterized protein n=1 Tax=Terrihabitans soli TaxID=708113 RepID=A0A6S6QL79_9HYPH|nr:hypothetical protein IZ6_07910 [Terrihabitans soli]
MRVVAFENDAAILGDGIRLICPLAHLSQGEHGRFEWRYQAPAFYYGMEVVETIPMDEVRFVHSDGRVDIFK